jgi:hypothetical protein
MQFFLVCHPRTTAYRGYSQERCPVKFKETKLNIAERDTWNATSPGPEQYQIWAGNATHDGLPREECSHFPPVSIVPF